MSFTSMSVARATNRNVTLVLIAAIGAALVGVLAARYSSTVAAGAVCALLLGVLLARVPEVVFGICLLALSYGPEYLTGSVGVFAQPQLQKGLLYFAILGMALHRGIRPRLLLVPVAYVVMAILSVLHGQLMGGLTLTQMLSSFVTLTVGWTALAVAWDLRADARYLKVLSILPLACVALGVLLQLAGVHALFRRVRDTRRGAFRARRDRLSSRLPASSAA